MAGASVGAAAAVHLVALVYAANGPLSGFMFWSLAYSLVPYGICFLAVMRLKLIGAGLVGLLVIVVIDVSVYWSAVVAPRHSTASLALVFAPIWQLVAALPCALFGFAIDAAVTRRWLDDPPANTSSG